MRSDPLTDVLTPGLPDDAFDHDGQLTKREIRALTLAALAPRPGELLWDVGAGSGSIGIEWLRANPAGRAVAFERDPARVRRIAANAVALGASALTIVRGAAPDVFTELPDGPAPDAVFIGGGLTVPGMVERCWAVLRPGGRLVANAVTVETEAEIVRQRALLGGELTRIQISRSAPVGRFTGWRASMPVTQWIVTRPAAVDPAPGRSADEAAHVAEESRP
ncbi:MAG: precorrin-6Y C5,15-methyltransferase (decarboxylating) subunit CbiT [Streptomycetaceae bacterium]|jgi:precorrin-6Y C5,15-methyltransferase (decarboxylating)|nr:precorrin-6Y C5,15-methyltransferase (decarboxylating) subunit CbiT [Streptomycetaceae bacterium]